MIRVRKASERGRAHHGWLDTRHTFSFADYRDPRHTRFRSLRVLNEDIIAPGQGFGTHPHQDMEILTLVLAGALAHRDSMGHEDVLRPGDFQRMSAGTGLTHSEFNASATEPVHLYQIWLFPERKGIEPGYETKRFPDEDSKNRWRLAASRDAAAGSLRIHQDARVYWTRLDAGVAVRHDLAAGRHAWLQTLRGAVSLRGDAPGAGVSLEAGDGAALGDESRLTIEARDAAELLLFDLA